MNIEILIIDYLATQYLHSFYEQTLLVSYRGRTLFACGKSVTALKGRKAQKESISVYYL